MATLTIADAAEAAGTSTDTIRYYDREGLLAGLSRDPAGNRRFTTDDVGWLRVLRCLRDTGMTMADLRAFCAVIEGKIEAYRGATAGTRAPEVVR